MVDFVVRLTFGKMLGKTVEELLLKEPDYIVWMLRLENPQGKMVEVVREAKRLIQIFDAKPFIYPCVGQKCEKLAAYCTVTRQAIQLVPWCDTCNPYFEQGESPGRLQKIRTYGDAVGHVDQWCGGTKGFLKTLIRGLAEEKGLPKRITAAVAETFFATQSSSPVTVLWPTAGADTPMSSYPDRLSPL